MTDMLKYSDESAGSLLRRTREAKGISLEEASRITRIGKNYLLDIEENHFEKLPNLAYVKGFLRSYAAFLELPAEAVLGLYDRSHQEEQPSPERPAEATEKRKPQPVAYVVVAAVVIVAAIGYMIGQEEELPPPAPPVQREVVPVPVPPVQAPVSSAKAPESPVAPKPSNQKAVSSDDTPAKGVFLRLKINEDTRIFMNIDGHVTQEYALNAGDLIEWKGEKFFIVDVDDPAAVEAELNGKKLQPLGPAGTPARVVLRPNGVAPDTQEQGER